MKLRCFAIYGALFMLWAVMVLGQSVSDGNKTGFPVFGTFHGSDLDTVSLNNGNLHIEIPIASFPQRHGQFTYRLIYDTPSYTLTYYKDPSGVYWSADIAQDETPGRAWRLSGPFGWSLNYREDTITCQMACDPGGPLCIYTNFLRHGYEVFDPHGSKHPLALSYLYVPPNNAVCSPNVGSNQTTGLTLDGTGIWVQTTDVGRAAGQIVLKDGTEVVNASWKDSNGNTASSSSDMLGRNNLVQSSGPNGSILYTVTDSTGNPQTFRVDYTSINVTTNFCPLRSGLTGGTATCSEYTSTWQVPSRLTLPDGLYYQFTWSSAGDGTLQRLDLPTGGSIAYTYGAMRFNGMYSGAACVQNDPNCVPTTTYPVRQTVTSRAVTGNGTTATWNYSGYPLATAGSNLPPSTTTLTDPLGNQQLHSFGAWGNSSYETQVKYYQGSSSNGTLIRTVNEDYAADPDPTVANSFINVRLIRETTILENGLTKKTETDYETTTVPCSSDACPKVSPYTATWLNPTEVREYDWGAGAPGPLLRRTDTTYLHSSNSTYLNLNIADRPTSKLTYDGSGNLIAQAAFQYDGYGAAGLAGTSGATGHDYTNFSTSYTTRGNLTQESRWRKTDGAWLNTSHTYDDLGNVRSTTDPNGNPPTTFSYDDNWANSNCVPAAVNTQAYATQATNALGQKTKTAYYPCTGLAQAFQNQNDINAGRTGTTYTYDLMNRLLTVNYPDNGQASFDHHGDALPLKVTKTVSATPDPSIVSSVTHDDLGRVSQTSIDSAPGCKDLVDTTYDALGRVATVSNPHCSTSDTSVPVTTTQYDALDRVTQVTKQDGSIGTVAYDQTSTVSTNATCTTSTDEAGSPRKTCSDGLGRLIEVDEPGDASSGAKASGTIGISGTLQSQSGVGAYGSSTATAQVSISGTDQSKTILVPPRCPRPPQPCDQTSETYYNNGKFYITINGNEYDYWYGSSGNAADYPISVAYGLVTAIQGDSARVVNASVPSGGTTITLTAIAVGSAGNSISFTTGSTWDTANFSAAAFTASPTGANLSGGVDAYGGITVYDQGTVTVSVGSGFSASAPYSQSGNSSAAQIASALVNDPNTGLNRAGSPVQASLNGPTTIQITYGSVGSAGNVAVTTSVQSTQTQWTFSPPSFSGSSTTLGGGSDPYPSGLAHPYVTQYSYDGLGNITCAVQKAMDPSAFTTCAAAPAAWRPRSFTYDSLSRLLTANNPESGQTSYTYDANGNVLTKSAPAPNQTGSATVVTCFGTWTGTNCDGAGYDALNRITKKSYSDGKTPTVGFTYDAPAPWGWQLSNYVGQLVVDATYDPVTGALLTANLYNHDPMGRVSLHEQGCTAGNCSALPSDFVAYSFDLAGGLLSQQEGQGGVFNVTYSYTNDAAGRPTGMSSSVVDAQHPATLASGIAYDPPGNIRLITYGNGLTGTNVYNKRLQPCRSNINSAGAALGNCPDAVPTGNVQDFTYGFNLGSGDNGNLVSMTAVGNQSFNRSYTYDALNRLVTMTAPNDSCSGLSWKYDAWGNRTAQNVTGGSCPAPQTTADATNRIVGYNYDSAGNMTADGQHGYLYDAENRIISVDGGSTTYMYDAPGLRVTKTTAGAWRNYLFGTGGEVVAETTANGWQVGYAYLGGQLLAQYRDSTTYFVHHDHLGSTRLLTRLNQTPFDSMDYLPYGEQISGDTGTTHKFTGKERDSETGLDLMGARYYSSSLGRFTKPDPLMIQKQKLIDPQQWNMYAYARNNPLRYIDPTGLYLCADSAKCDSKQDKAFEKARQDDLKSKDPNVVRGAQAYGDPTKDNGTTVQFGDPGKNQNGNTATGNMREDPNHPGTYQAVTTVTIKSGLSGTALDAAVGHEGTHVADAQAFAATFDGMHWDLSKNLTKYQTELNAYRVTQAIQAAANEKAGYGVGCSGGPCIFGPGVRNIDETINQLLADPRNGYGVTPANQGPRQFDINTPPPNN